MIHPSYLCIEARDAVGNRGPDIRYIFLLFQNTYEACCIKMFGKNLKIRVLQYVFLTNCLRHFFIQIINWLKSSSSAIIFYRLKKIFL